MTPEDKSVSLSAQQRAERILNSMANETERHFVKGLIAAEIADAVAAHEIRALKIGDGK